MSDSGYDPKWDLPAKFDGFVSDMRLGISIEGASLTLHWQGSHGLTPEMGQQALDAVIQTPAISMALTRRILAQALLQLDTTYDVVNLSQSPPADA